MARIVRTRRTTAVVLLGLGVAGCHAPEIAVPYGVPTSTDPPQAEPVAPRAIPVELRELYAHIRNYDRSRLYALACHGFEPSQRDIGAFEQTVGFKLPEVFREFMLSFGCFAIMAQPEIADRAPPPVGVRIGTGIRVFGVVAGRSSQLAIDTGYDGFRRHTGESGRVPFLQVGDDPDVFCFDQSGTITRWDHRARVFRPVDLSFPQLLLRELRDLEASTAQIAP